MTFNNFFISFSRKAINCEDAPFFADVCEYAKSVLSQKHAICSLVLRDANRSRNMRYDEGTNGRRRDPRGAYRTFSGHAKQGNLQFNKLDLGVE